MKTQIFINELDVEIMEHLARGRSIKRIAERIGYGESRTYERLRNLQCIFGAVTTSHLVAIAISSDVIRTSDLYDDDLARAVHVQRAGGGEKQSYHLQSLRHEILNTAVDVARI